MIPFSTFLPHPGCPTTRVPRRFQYQYGLESKPVPPRFLVYLDGVDGAFSFLTFLSTLRPQFIPLANRIIHSSPFDQDPYITLPSHFNSLNHPPPPLIMNQPVSTNLNMAPQLEVPPDLIIPPAAAKLHAEGRLRAVLNDADLAKYISPKAARFDCRQEDAAKILLSQTSRKLVTEEGKVEELRRLLEGRGQTLVLKEKGTTAEGLIKCLKGQMKRDNGEGKVLRLEEREVEVRRATPARPMNCQSHVSLHCGCIRLSH